MLVSFLISFDTAVAQDAKVSSAPVPLAQMLLENVHIQGQSVSELLSRLALKYEIPIGLEMARPGKLPTFCRLDLWKGTFTDLLTQFVTDHNEYTWQIEDGVVSIFPRDAYRDHLMNQLLATEINDFSVKKGTVTWTLSQSLFSTPEIETILEPYELSDGSENFSGFFFQQLGKEFSFSVSHMKLKSILDKIIKESPVAKFWIVSNNYLSNSVTLIVNASAEYPPEERYLKDAKLDDMIELWP